MSWKNTIGFKRLLYVRIRDFEPLTDNDNPIERKTALLAEIKKHIDLEKIKNIHNVLHGFF